MELQAAQESEARFGAYVQELASVIGHKDREEPLRDYSRGLLTACGRKSVEPLAAVTAPAEVAAKHTSPHWHKRKWLRNFGCGGATRSKT